MSDKVAADRHSLVAVAAVMVVGTAHWTETKSQMPNKIVGIIMGAIAHISLLVAAPAKTNNLNSIPKENPVTTQSPLISPLILLHSRTLEWLALRLITLLSLLKANTQATACSFLPSLP